MSPAVNSKQIATISRPNAFSRWVRSSAPPQPLLKAARLRMIMEIDPPKCLNCGKPFQSSTDAEAICDCGNSPKHQPIQAELEILAPLPCPKCGHQKHATASMIGKPENCRCGYQFRYTLVLSPIRHESLAWIPSVKRRVTVGCRKSIYWWRQSAIPWMNRTATYVRGHVIPRIVNISKSRCK